MFDFLKKRMIVAEVDGIKFYSEKAFRNYIAAKKREEELRRSRIGKKQYTFEIPWYHREGISQAKVYLEGQDCLDYTVKEEGYGYTVRYWADHQILRWKK